MGDFSLISQSSFDGFTAMPESEIDQYIFGSKPQTTLSKEKTDENQFDRFARSINESRKLHEIPAEELNNILCQFFMKATTTKGKLYEPDTLTSFLNSFQRILDARKVKINLKEDGQFLPMRKVLSRRRKELTGLGKGNKPNACRSLSPEEVDFLFSVNFFGDDNAECLYRAVWWFSNTQFGHRARDEARQMKVGDIAIVTDVLTGRRYLEWDTERCTKTRDGARPMGHARAFNPKAHETGGNRCPVRLFEKFLKKVRSIIFAMNDLQLLFRKMCCIMCLFVKMLCHILVVAKGKHDKISETEISQFSSL